MIDNNTVFDDYVLWEEGKRVEKAYDKLREERKFTIKYSNKEKLKGNYQSIMVEGLLYLEKTKRDRYGDWSYVLRLMPHIKYPENCISINGENPTQVQLAELFKIKPRQMRNVLVELEYMEIIKIKRVGKNNVIYVNPFFIRSGAEIYTETCEMFRETTFCSIMNK